jgi:hypothetical protein
MELAYIDPSSGSILLQLIFGSLVGVMVAVRRSLTRLLFWRR